MSGAQNITANVHYYSTCTQNNYTVTFSVNSEGYVSKSSAAGSTAFTGTVSVKAGSEVKVSGNELYFTDNSSVKYYALASIPTGYVFNSWSNVSNGDKINANRTIGASWTAKPYTCKDDETKVTDTTYGASSGGVVCTKDKTRYVYTSGSGIGCDYEYWDRGLGNYSGAITNGTSVLDYTNECVGCERGYTIEDDDYYSYASGNQCNNTSGCRRYIWGSWQDFEYGDWMDTSVYYYICKRTATCIDSWGAYPCTQYGKINSSHYSMACGWAYSDYPNSTSANTACYRAADPPTN